MPPPLPPCQETTNNLKAGAKLALMPSPKLSPHPCVVSSQGKWKRWEAGSTESQGKETEQGQPPRLCGSHSASPHHCPTPRPPPRDLSPCRALPGGPWPQEVALRHLLMEEPCEQVTSPSQYCHQSKSGATYITWAPSLQFHVKDP